MLDNAKAAVDVLKYFVPVLAGVAAMKTIFIDKIETRFGERGPAVVMTRMVVESAGKGTVTPYQLSFSKLRSCKPNGVSLTVTDSAGRIHNAETNWGRTILPMGQNQTMILEMVLPRTIATGPAVANLIAVHDDCTNGGQKPPAQSITSEPFEVLK